MLESLAVYCFLIWIFFYKLKVIKFTTTLKIIFTIIGIVWLTVCWIGLERYTPSSEDKAFIQSPVVQLRPQSRGIIKEVFVEANQFLKKGTPILQVNPDPYQYQLEKAEANLLRSQAEMDLAEIEFERTKKTYKDLPGAVSQLEIDRKNQNVKAAQAQFKATAKEVEIAKFDLKETTVYAPSDGYIVNLQVRPGLYVSIAKQPVISFVKSDEVWIVAIIPQNGAAQVKPGNAAEATFNLYPPYIFEAEVVDVVWATGESQGQISGRIPNISELIQTGAYVVKLKLKKEYPDKPLRFGSKGTVVINTGKLDLAWAVRKLEVRMIAWLNLIF